MDITEIRPIELMKIKEKMYEEDLDILLQDKLILTNCPACGRNDYVKLFQKMKFDFVLCTNCETLFVNPRPSTKSIEAFYKSSKSMQFWNKIFNDTAKVRKEKIFKPRINLVKNILSSYHVNDCKTLVEIGAGYGWFCELAKQEKISSKIIAIEPSPFFAERCREISGIDVIESTVENLTTEIQADILVNFEVIAHLYNPREFVRKCYEILENNGIFICSTPNYYGLDIQILKKNSDTIVPHTLNLFNIESIRILLESVGFRNIKVITPGKMDVSIILNKIKLSQIDSRNYPFFSMLLEHNNEDFIDEFQKLIIKYNMSSHMFISAQK